MIPEFFSDISTILSTIAIILPGFISVIIIERLLLIKEVNQLKYTVWSFTLSLVTFFIYFIFVKGFLTNTISSKFGEFNLYSLSTILVLSLVVGFIGAILLKILNGYLAPFIILFLQKFDKIKKIEGHLFQLVMSNKSKYVIITTKSGLKYYGAVKYYGELDDSSKQCSFYLEKVDIINNILNENEKLSKIRLSTKLSQGIIIPENEISHIEIVPPKPNNKKGGIWRR